MKSARINDCLNHLLVKQNVIKADNLAELLVTPINIICLGRVMARAVSRRLPTAAAQIQTRVWSCGRWGRFSRRTSVSPANLHSICFSKIIFTITRGWHNRPGMAAVPSLTNQIK
jgi:hypothetical protein